MFKATLKGALIFLGLVAGFVFFTLALGRVFTWFITEPNNTIRWLFIRWERPSVQMLDDYKHDELIRLERSARQSRISWHEETERVAGRNAWVRALRESVQIRTV